MSKQIKTFLFLFTSISRPTGISRLKCCPTTVGSSCKEKILQQVALHSLFLLSNPKQPKQSKHPKQPKDPKQLDKVDYESYFVRSLFLIEAHMSRKTSNVSNMPRLCQILNGHNSH